jgi:hypothetical protein
VIAPPPTRVDVNRQRGLDTSGCGSPAYAGEESGDGYHSYVWYDNSRNHTAVLLLDKDRANAEAAARRLYCRA